MSRGRCLVVSPPRSGEFDGISDYSSRLSLALSNVTPTTHVTMGHELEAERSSDVSAVLVQYYPHAFLGGDGRAMRRWLRSVHGGGVQVIVTMHELWPPGDGSLRRLGARAVMKHVAAQVIAHASTVVCTQERSASELQRAGLIAPERTPIIPVGSNLDRVDAASLPPRSAHTLSMFGQPAAMHGPTLVALAGWLDQQRGAVTLRWLNRSVDESLHTLVDTLRLPADHVEFFGGLAIPAASGVLASADLAVAPYVDGVSTRRTTLAAQLQHGRPIVGTDGESTGALLRDQPAIALSPVGSPADFVANVDRLLRDSATRVTMGEAAAALYNAEFSWDRIAAAYSRLLLAECT